MCIAIGPFAIYALVIGGISVVGRPFVISGARDVAALFVGLLGIVLVGPAELLMPESTFQRYGPMAWPMLILLYALCCLLFILLDRPRIVIYNLPDSEVRPLLAEVLAVLDPEARWAGSSVAAPKARVEFQTVVDARANCVSLVGTGDNQDLQNWRLLETLLRRELRKSSKRRSRAGLAWFVAGVALAAMLTATLVQRQSEIAQLFLEMLRVNPL